MPARSSIKKYLYSMNKLPISRKVQIINLLVEVSSSRDALRIADVNIHTVIKLLVASPPTSLQRRRAVELDSSESFS